MGITVYSLLGMQDLYHQPLFKGVYIPRAKP